MLNKDDVRVYYFNEKTRKYSLLQDDEEGLAEANELRTIEQFRAPMEVGISLEYRLDVNDFLVTVNGIAQHVVHMEDLGLDNDEEVGIDGLPFVVINAAIDELIKEGRLVSRQVESVKAVAVKM